MAKARENKTIMFNKGRQATTVFINCSSQLKREPCCARAHAHIHEHKIKVTLSSRQYLDIANMQFVARLTVNVLIFCSKMESSSLAFIIDYSKY